MTDKPTNVHKPELMSPAGHWPQLRAAVQAGADAVYFGLNHFTARAKVGFSLQELPDAMRELHRSAVKGFVTFNTLVFDHEINQAAETIRRIADAGVDAVIVQDVGMAKLIGEIAPDLEIHGSTQMSVTSAQGVELAHSLGCTRVVLGRELDLKDIRRIAEATDVELEVFVHGALCVSYSGQCFSSEAWGGRSANRGKCAQACRLSYDLIVDGGLRDLGESRYLLSPGDLYAIEQIPDLVDIGIACVKIEGRYKDADYVTLTTRAYRAAIDAATNSENESNAVPKKDLEQVYSRGLGAHFMSGVNHQTVVRGRAPRHRGLQVGAVARVVADSVVVDCVQPIHAGDGLVFDSATWRSPDEPEEGGNVYEVIVGDGKRATLKFGRGDVDFSRIRKDDLVWRTKDPQLAKRINNSEPVVRRPENAIDFHVQTSVGTPLKVTAASKQLTAVFEDAEPLQQAQSRPLDIATLTEQLGRLGGTPFHLNSVKFESSENVFCPVSLLNRARRELVEQLLQQRLALPTASSFASAAVTKTAETKVAVETKVVVETSEPDTPSLHVLVRTAEQLDAAIECQPASITLDYLELYGLRPSVEKIKQAGIVARVASPRILKPNEQKIIRFLLSLECEILIRSGGLLHDLIQSGGENTNHPTLLGDFSLNAANALSCNYYLQLGLTRLSPTHDLNAQQIIDLANDFGAVNLEVIAYHHLPVFHTEHCVFCRFLSDGTDNTNCGHPCEKHQVALQDSHGRKHPVMADVGCRNTVFGAEAQTAARHLKKMLACGLRHYRLEFVHESPAAVQRITNTFGNYFAGTLGDSKFQTELKKLAPQGTTEGSLFVPQDFKQLVQLS